MSRAAVLADRLRRAADTLIACVETLPPELWMQVPGPGVWSPGKEAEHVAEGAAYHQWIVRLCLGQRVPPRPRIERRQLIAQRSQAEFAPLLRQRTQDGIALIAGLSDDQLDLPARPPRARSPALAEMIERVLIGHYQVHRAEIEAKVRDGVSSG